MTERESAGINHAHVDKPKVEVVTTPIVPVAPEIIPEGLVKKEEVKKSFPVEEKKKEIIAGLRAHKTFLLEGETGSGKSSFAPGYVLEARQMDHPNARVIVTQPRRVAVDETYNRVKGIVGEDKVAFRHGGGHGGPEDAKITIMVDASLTNEIKRNPTLKGVTDVVIDEAHEEGTNMIVNMGLLKKIQRDRATTDDPLHITYTTATFDKEKHLRYNPDAGDIHVTGRIFDVDKRFIDNPHLISDDPKEAEEINKRIFEGIQRDAKGDIEVRDLPIVAARVTNEVLQYHKDGGDPVVILPGKAEIDAAVKEFKRLNPNQEYAVLMGGKKGTEDAAAFKKMHHEEGKRIAFFASEVVEASVTIDKATDVIDGGYSRKPYFDPKTGLSELRTVKEAKANNKQRVGRAGRTREGRSITLLSKEVMEKQPEHLPSELQRADLTGMILTLKAHGFNNIHKFDFIDKPDTDAINVALQRLYQLGAIDDKGKITEDIGEEMAGMPLEPHFSRMLVEAKRLGCVEEMHVAMGFLNSTKSIFPKPFKGEVFSEKYEKFAQEGSDILTHLAVWNDFVSLGGDRKKILYWSMNNHINLDGLYDARSIAHDLFGNDDLAKEGMKIEGKPLDIDGKKHLIVQSLIAGIGDRIMVKAGETYTFADGRKKGIIRTNTSVVANPEYMVAGSLRSDEKSGKTYASMNQVISKEVHNTMMERISHTPSGVLLDKKEGDEVVTLIPHGEEIVEPDQYESLAPVVLSKNVVNPDSVKEISQEEKNKSVLASMPAPVRWIGEDVQALTSSIRKGFRWLLTGKTE